MARTAPHGRLGGIARGLGALVLLIVLLAGIPAALALLAGNPLPHHLPGGHEILTVLTSPDSGALFLRTVAIVGWLGWASFAAAFVVEIPARLRGRQALRLPGLGVQQRWVAALVAGVALLATSPAVAAAAGPTPVYAAPPAATAAAAAPSTASTPATTPAAAYTEPAYQQHVVQRGEALKDVAARYLGDGEKWRTIADANYGRPQPDGRSLEHGRTRIYPGWTLRIPTDAIVTTPVDTSTSTTTDTQARTVTVQAGDSLSSIAARELGDPNRWHALFELNKGVAQPDGGRLSNPSVIQPGWVLRLPATAHHTHTQARTVTVQAGDSLSSIAARELGNPDRWHELFTANRGVAQRDGGRLTDPNLIEPGWVLRLPSTPATVPPQHRDTKPTTPRHTAPPDATPPTPTHQPDTSARPTPPASTRPTAPSQHPDHDQAPAATHDDPTARAGTADDGGGIDVPWAATAGVGGLLAAGLLSLLAILRAQQRRRRRPRHRIRMPEPAAAATELELRQAEAPDGVGLVDRALRYTADHANQTGAALPNLLAARFTGRDLELYLAVAADPLPPFRSDPDTRHWWHLDPAARPHLTVDRDVPAPYPALVTLGHDTSGAHILLDLEGARALTIAGDPTDATAALRAMAVELAVSKWADHAVITLVGVGAELADALDTGRIRYADTLDEVLPRLQHRADAVQQVLAADHSPSILDARARGVAGDAWTPEIILVGISLTDHDHQQLTELVAAVPRTSLAAVLTTPDGAQAAAPDEWQLTLGDAGAGRLTPLGVDLTAQRLDDEAFAQVVALLRAANDQESIPETASEATVDRAETTVGSPMEETIEATGEAGPEPAPDTPAPDTPAADAPQWRPATRRTSEDGHLELTFAVRATEPEVTPRPEPGTEPEPEPAAAAAIEQPDASGEPEGSDTAEQPDPEHVGATTSGPGVLLLGPVEVDGADGPVEQSKRNRLTELAAYLVLHPAGVSSDDLTETMWPGRRISVQTRNTTVSKLRAWLGADYTGQPYLPEALRTGRYLLTDTVRCDWLQFQQLAERGHRTPGPRGTADLAAALDLVRGQPFQGAPPRRYAWAEAIKQEMIQSIEDTAHELAGRLIDCRDFPAARRATAAGLLAEPGSELLYRDLFRAEHLAGNRAGLQRAIEQLTALLDEMELDMQPETAALIDELLAGRRAQAV